MKKVIDAMFSGYLNDQFEEFMPKYSITSTEEEYDKFLKDMTQSMSNEKKRQFYNLKNDSEYEIIKREFTNAFRLSFILCAEVFLGE